MCPDCFARVGKSAPASTRATTALVLGLIGMSGCLPFGYAGLVLGYLEKSAIERGESEPGGRNLAVGAIWIGWFTIALSAGLFLLFVLLVAMGVAGGS